MGQANLPMLNRTGETIFWSANNENVINYMRCFTIGFFLQKITVYLMHSRTTSAFFFYTNLNFNFINFLDDFYKYVPVRAHKHIFIKHRILRFEKKLKTYYKFFKNKQRILSKVFFFMYYNWIVITVRVYRYTRKSFYFKKKKKITGLLLFWKHLMYNFFFFNSDIPTFLKSF